MSLDQRFRIISDFNAKFNTPEIIKESDDELQKILSQETITPECLELMIEYIALYNSREDKFKNEKHTKVLQKDLEILNAVKEIEDREITKQLLLDLGVSLCTILTGFQKKWINQWSEEISQYKNKYIEKSPDYKRYNLLPGQHMFYYGAFTGIYTKKLSPATHHFVYLGKGLIIEVGTDKITGCLDTDIVPKKEKEEEEKEDSLWERGKKWVSSLSYDPRMTYKPKMSYFGISTLPNAAIWATKYGQSAFFVYEYPNDASKKIMRSRLERGRKIIGKWMYSLLFLSNNCENAASYVSHGISKSTQACVSDMLFNSIQSIVNLPSSVVNLIGGNPTSVVNTGVFTSRNSEEDLKFSAEIPTCNSSGSYSPRFVTKKNYICKGLPYITGDITSDWQTDCKIDLSTCQRCEKEQLYEDEVTDNKPKKICEKSRTKHSAEYRILE